MFGWVKGSGVLQGWGYLNGVHDATIVTLTCDHCHAPGQDTWFHNTVCMWESGQFPRGITSVWLGKGHFVKTDLLFSLSSFTFKVHKVFPKVTFPPWLHPVKIWVHTVSG